MKLQGPWCPRLLLAAGLAVYFLVQGALLNLPLAHWSLLPELDDSLTYVLKTRQLQECLAQNCPALEDLKHQLLAPTADPAAARAQDLARSRLFPVYHPLFSLLLLGLQALGLELLAAYQWLWRLSPLIFGGAFACLLLRLVGPAATGVALALLAFKVFPDTGLHHLVPSNLTMAGAVVVWARLLARQGWAPWTLVISALLLPGLHPVGVLYSLVSLGLALSLAAPQDRRRLLLVVAGAILVLSAFFLISAWSTGIFLVRFTLLPAVPDPVSSILTGAGQNLQAVVIGIIRSAGGLFGSAPFFLAALVLGWLTLPDRQRRPVGALLALNLLLLLVMLFYVSSHPGDVILRLWIPLVVLLFGLVGQAPVALAGWCRLSQKRADVPASGAASAGPTTPMSLAPGLPLILLAMFFGYAVQMAAVGAEQIVTYSSYLRQRQPLALSPQQPGLLLAQASPGDRVMYNSLILMPYYFIHGAMRLGAIYYHPALKTAALEEVLRQPGVRFAVTYNPTVFHPTFVGQEEPRWWITSPSFRYSPLDRPRRFGPLAREGRIAMGEYHWLEVAVTEGPSPRVLRLQIDNPAEAAALTITAPVGGGDSLPDRRITVVLPAQSSGWLPVDLTALGQPRRLRLIFPAGDTGAQLGGLVFGDNAHNWPWAERATLQARPREPGAPDIHISFDPRALLPPPLQHREITILDDRGSAVLLRLD